MTSPIWSPVSRARSSRLTITAAPRSMSLLMSISFNTVNRGASGCAAPSASGFLFHIAARRRLDRLVLAITGYFRSGNLLAAERPQPVRPVGPPAAGMLLGMGEPGLGGGRQGGAAAD